MNRKTIAEFDRFVEIHNQEIYFYLWRMLRDPQDADDALQESFIRAFRGFPRLRDDSNLRAWLYKIATNVAYTHLKRRSQQESRIVDLTVFHASTDHTEQRDLLEAVLKAVEKLPQKQRTALLLRNYQGLEYAEIAKTLNCSEESARANVYQALKKLRSQFTEEEV